MMMVMMIQLNFAQQCHLSELNSNYYGLPVNMGVPSLITTMQPKNAARKE
jgi:hypothetical protein